MNIFPCRKCFICSLSYSLPNLYGRTSRGLHPLANALCLDLQRHHLNFSMASPSKTGCRANSLSKVGLIDPQGTIKRLFTTCCGEILQFSSSLWKLWYELLRVIISSPAWLTNWSYIYIPCNLWCDLTFMEAGNHNRSSLECVPKCSIDQGTEYAWPIFECATALAGAQHIWHWALTLLISPFLLAQAFPFGQTIRTTPKFLRFHAFQRSMDEYLRFLLLVSPILRSWIILSPGYISNGWSSEPRAAHSSGKRV
jgi:hypothetical protein